MSRLIDADELVNELNKLDLDYGAMGGVAECIDIIENTPTIEPNELDLDIDYSIEYDKRPDGISNAKVTITRIKPRNIIACEEVNELDMLERMYAEPRGDLVSRQLLIGAIEKCGEEKIYPQALIETIKALPIAEPKWITDRKPTEDGKYIVTLDAFGHHRFIVLMHYGKPLMPNREVKGMCWYMSDSEWGDIVYDDEDILAWLSLPTPYGESEVEE